jgi:hypothetical protein
LAAKPTPLADGEKVINAVRQLNAGKANERYDQRFRCQLGPGRLYEVTYIGEDKNQHKNYVFERDGQLRPYYEIWNIVQDKQNGFVQSYEERQLRLNMERFRLKMVFALILVFVVMLIAIACEPLFLSGSAISDNKQLEFLLTALISALVGYLVGHKPIDHFGSRAADAQD